MHLTVGGSTHLSATLHTGSTLGMVTVALLGARALRGRGPSLRALVILGCVASAALLAVLGTMATRPAWPLAATVSALGFANGVFAVAAIGSMMELAAAHADGRSGLRMGLWGAAQALAFATGGILAALLVDVVRQMLGQPVGAYAVVFLCQATLFLTAAWIAARLESRSNPARGTPRRGAAAPIATLETQ
jgi:BCD family chlorophyll transporter-like MFS transporter